MAVGDRILRPMYDVNRALVEQADGSYAQEVAVGTGGGPLVTAGTTVKPQSTLIRPADTNTYAAGDVIATSTSAPVAKTITVARVAAGTGLLMNAMLIDSAAPALAGEFEAWLFHTAPALDNDNATFTPTAAELLNLVCVIPFTSSLSYVGTSSGNRVYQSEAIYRNFVCAAASQVLTWVLVARNAYIPVSAETFTLQLSVSQD